MEGRVSDNQPLYGQRKQIPGKSKATVTSALLARPPSYDISTPVNACLYYIYIYI